jgi:hypothetical protein
VQCRCHHLDEERLKLRAQRHGCALQGELKAILQAAVTFSMSETRSVADQGQDKLAPQNTSGQAGDLFRDSAEAIHAGRGR